MTGPELLPAAGAAAAVVLAGLVAWLWSPRERRRRAVRRDDRARMATITSLIEGERRGARDARRRGPRPPS